MTRLSPFDPDRPPFKPGDRVRLAPVEDWAGSDAELPRPIECEYLERGGGPQRTAWTAELDAAVGREFAVVRLSSAGLPVVDAPGGGQWRLHPDWLEAADAGCTCPLADLMHRGCRCGQMARERAAARAT